jgi:hypothetical protein
MIIWRNKFIESINAVDSFYTSKLLNTKEEFENMKIKIFEKKKEFVKPSLNRFLRISLT